MEGMCGPVLGSTVDGESSRRLGPESPSQPDEIKLATAQEANFISFLCDVELDLAFVSPICLTSGNKNVVEVIVKTCTDSEVSVTVSRDDNELVHKRGSSAEDTYMLRCVL
jgi:hypothetical protein